MARLGTRRGLLTERQHVKVTNLWQEHTEHVAFEVTYMAYQDIIDAYAHPKRSVGKRLMRKVMVTIRKGLPTGLEELAQLGRTLSRVVPFIENAIALRAYPQVRELALAEMTHCSLHFRRLEMDTVGAACSNQMGGFQLFEGRNADRFSAERCFPGEEPWMEPSRVGTEMKSR